MGCRGTAASGLASLMATPVGDCLHSKTSEKSQMLGSANAYSASAHCPALNDCVAVLAPQYTTAAERTHPIELKNDMSTYALSGARACGAK